MLQIERVDDREESLRVALKGYASNLWTALPGIVQSYDATKGTCTVQPSIQAQVTDLTTGETKFVNLPVLPDVPVVYMGGGNFVATFPIQQGDEALVIFSSRCIDAWWQNGGVQAQAELRMHDLSDGFALIGPRSLARAIPSVSTSAAQLRSLDGSAYYELAEGGIANIVAPGGINITGNLTVDGAVSFGGESTEATINGNLNLQGTLSASGEGTFKGVAVSTHVHSGVTSGGGTSGPPVG